MANRIVNDLCGTQMSSVCPVVPSLYCRWPLMKGTYYYNMQRTLHRVRYALHIKISLKITRLKKKLHLPLYLANCLTFAFSNMTRTAREAAGRMRTQPPAVIAASLAPKQTNAHSPASFYTCQACHATGCQVVRPLCPHLQDIVGTQKERRGAVGFCLT